MSADVRGWWCCSSTVRWTGLSTLLWILPQLTHTMTETGPHTTWGTHSAKVVLYSRLCYTHIHTVFLTYLTSAGSFVFWDILRFLLQHHPCASSWRSGISRPDRSLGDLFHPCSWGQEAFLLSQLWWDTRSRITKRLRCFKFSACWMYIEVELMNSRGDLVFACTDRMDPFLLLIITNLNSGLVLLPFVNHSSHCLSLQLPLSLSLYNFVSY